MRKMRIVTDIIKSLGYYWDQDLFKLDHHHRPYIDIFIKYYADTLKCDKSCKISLIKKSVVANYGDQL